MHKLILLSAFFVAAMGVAERPAAAQANAPGENAARDAGTRTYRFTVVYSTVGPTGQVTHRQRVAGDYTQGLAKDQVEWNHVTVADADGQTAPYAAPQGMSFMDGFRYGENANSMAPDFFQSFPASAVMERNLVWDTQMFEAFGRNYPGMLRLNEPLHLITDQEIQLPELGSFRNRDVVLEWVGRSERNGQACALIDYRAFFNPVQIATGGLTLEGHSEYWGEIWVATATGQIEYATLYEEVNGRMKLPGQTAEQPLSVVRTGILEPEVADPGIPEPAGAGR